VVERGKRVGELRIERMGRGGIGTGLGDMRSWKQLMMSFEERRATTASIQCGRI
jgi:hypothetical protein